MSIIFRNFLCRFPGVRYCRQAELDCHNWVTCDPSFIQPKPRTTCQHVPRRSAASLGVNTERKVKRGWNEQKYSLKFTVNLTTQATNLKSKHALMTSPVRFQMLAGVGWFKTNFSSTKRLAWYWRTSQQHTVECLAFTWQKPSECFSVGELKWQRMMPNPATNKTHLA